MDAREREGGGPDPTASVSLVEERGSFSHAVCRVCSWVGPARRARQRARADADLHADADECLELPAGAAKATVQQGDPTAAG